MPPLDELLRARLETVPRDWPASSLRHAAVLCPVVDVEGDDHLLFGVRPDSLRQHGGQIGFPGGMREDGESPEATALRECREEIGVAAAAVTILGALPARESSSGILVQCLVGRLATVELELDAREVERALYMPVSELCDLSRWAERPPPIRARGRQPKVSPHFHFGDDLLWGLTGRFVRELVTRLSR